MGKDQSKMSKGGKGKGSKETSRDMGSEDVDLGIAAVDAEFLDDNQLNVEEIRALVLMFKKYGNKSGGGVSFSKFQKLAAKARERFPEKKSAFTPESVEACFQFLDINNDDSVDLEEFVAGIAVIVGGSIEQRAEIAFKSIDLNDDGFISRQELSARVDTVYKLADAAMNKQADRQGMNFHNKRSMALAMRAGKAEFKRKVLRAFFRGDSDKDSKLDFEEWMEAVHSGNEEVLAFLNPSTSVVQAKARITKDISGPVNVSQSKIDLKILAEQKELKKEIKASRIVKPKKNKEKEEEGETEG